MRWTNEHKHNTSTALKMAVTKVIKTMTGHCLDCNKMYYYAFLPPASVVEVIESELSFVLPSVCQHSHSRTV